MKRIAPFICVTLLAAIPVVAFAQDAAGPENGDAAAPQTPANDPLTQDPPVRPVMLLIKSDWSKAPAAKEIEADVRAVLQDVPNAKDQLSGLPSNAPAILFSPDLIGLYTAEQYAELLGWLKAKDLVHKVLPLENPQLTSTATGGRRGGRGGLNRSVAVYFQRPDFLKLPPIPQAESQPFIEREVGFTWTFTIQGQFELLQVERELGLAEKRRGQLAFQAAQTLDRYTMVVENLRPGHVALMHAFPGRQFRQAVEEQGYFALLGIQRNGGESAEAQPPRLVLPLEVQKMGGGGPGPRLAWGSDSMEPLPGATTPSATGSTTTKAGEERTIVIALQHASVESALPIVKQLLPAGARIVGDPERQQLFVSGSQADIEKVNEIIGQIDKPAKAATTAEPLGAGPPQPDNYRSEFIRKLQSQLLVPTQQQTLPLKTDLQRQYEAAEQEAQAAAQQWRQLTAKSGDVQTSAEIAAVRTRLQAAVAKAFDARQKLQQAELLEMQRRIYSLAGTIESREKLKDQIIDRRVQELLNPALDWNPPASSAATTTTKGSSLPQYPFRQYPATGSLQKSPAKAAPANGVIFQVRGDLVDVSLGSDDGIAVGQILHVHRGDEYVAELEVLVTQLDRLVARIKRKLGSLRPDDRVSNKEPVQAAGDSSAGPVRSEAGQPLSDAVREFNAANADNPLSTGQPPLTDDEVVAAIRWLTRDRADNAREEAIVRVLTSIAESRMLPPGARLELQTDFPAPDPLAIRDGRKLTMWAIFVRLANNVETPSLVLIRKQYIRSEPPATQHSPLNADWVPLTPAVDEFNQRHRTHSTGKDQPPITKDEVLTALREWLTRREKLPVTNAEFQELAKIAATEQLPPSAEFEVVTSFQPDDQWQFEAWSVRLRVSHGPDGGRGGGSYAYTIRDRWLKARRIGERKIAWGPETNSGVQVGLWLDPPSEVYTKGQRVVPHFFFRNASVVERGISLPRIMTRGYYEALHVTDDKGETIQIDQEEGPTGPVGWTQLPFTPGAMHEVVGLPIVLGQVKRPPGVETVICALERQECRLRFSVDDYLDPDKDEKPTTGEVRFRLAGE